MSCLVSSRALFIRHRFSVFLCLLCNNEFQSSMPLSEKNRKTVVSLTTGSIAGGVECICGELDLRDNFECDEITIIILCLVWPMEYIKTQLQLIKPVAGVKPPFTGVVDGLTYTVKTTGFLSLYRGLSVTLAGSIPKAGIRLV